MDIIGPPEAEIKQEQDSRQIKKLKLNKNKKYKCQLYDIIHAETLIKPCVFAHPGEPSGLRRASSGPEAWGPRGGSI